MSFLRGDVERLEADRYKAMLAGDLEALGEILDEELIYTHSFGDRDTKASYLKKVSEGFFDYRDIKYTIDQLIERGDSATIVGRMHASATVGGEERILNNVYTAVWGKVPGAGWKLIAFQPTPLIGASDAYRGETPFNAPS